MNEERIKKIISNYIENDDPYWNTVIYQIINSIIELNNEDESSISELFNSSNYTTKQLFDIYDIVIKVCKKLNINLDFSANKNKTIELPFNMKFIKQVKEVLMCPNCSKALTYLMPNGHILSCNNCKKYYFNNNGKVCNETTTPYNKNNVLY